MGSGQELENKASYYRIEWLGIPEGRDVGTTKARSGEPRGRRSLLRRSNGGLIQIDGHD
jgi:hypothetical protein